MRYDTRRLCDYCLESLSIHYDFASPQDAYCKKCLEESYSAPYWRDEAEFEIPQRVPLAAGGRDIRRMLLEQQHGRCAICARNDVALVVDHDHDTGYVRGLLCYPCNTGLGNFRDSLQLLSRASEYLTNHKKSEQRIFYSDHKRYTSKRLKRS